MGSAAKLQTRRTGPDDSKGRPNRVAALPLRHDGGFRDRTSALEIPVGYC
jgi:hypothetical protein